MITLISAPLRNEHLPQEQREDDDSSEQVEQHEEDCVPLRVIGFWLLIATCDIHHGCHDVDPTFQGYDLEQDQDRLPERVECPSRGVKSRVRPNTRDEVRQGFVHWGGIVLPDTSGLASTIAVVTEV